MAYITWSVYAIDILFALLNSLGFSAKTVKIFIKVLFSEK